MRAGSGQALREDRPRDHGRHVQEPRGAQETTGEAQEGSGGRFLKIS